MYNTKSFKSKIFSKIFDLNLPSNITFNKYEARKDSFKLQDIDFSYYLYVEKKFELSQNGGEFPWICYYSTDDFTSCVCLVTYIIKILVYFIYMVGSAIAQSGGVYGDNFKIQNINNIIDGNIVITQYKKTINIDYETYWVYDITDITSRTKGVIAIKEENTNFKNIINLSEEKSSITTQYNTKNKKNKKSVFSMFSKKKRVSIRDRLVSTFAKTPDKAFNRMSSSFINMMISLYEDNQNSFIRFIRDKRFKLLCNTLLETKKVYTTTNTNNNTTSNEHKFGNILQGYITLYGGLDVIYSKRGLKPNAVKRWENNNKIDVITWNENYLKDQIQIGGFAHLIPVIAMIGTFMAGIVGCAIITR